MPGLTSKQLNMAIAAALALALLWVYRRAGAVVTAGQDAIKPITDPIGKALAEARYGAPGSGVQSTQSYIVLRQRDFSSAGVMNESAYTAASKMHASNVSILQRVLTVGRRLQEPYLSAVKSNSEIIVTLDGSIHKF